MSRLFRVIQFAFRALRNAPGEAIVMQVKGVANDTREIEFYQLPGISSGPTEEDRVITVNMGGYTVAVASHNYRIGIAPQAGEVIIYSTDAAGNAKQAEVKLTPDGNIELNGSGRTLVTHAELDAALQTFITALNLHTHSGVSTGSGVSGPPSAPATINISEANADTLRTGL